MRPHEKLERELEEWTGMPHVVACSSGTAALHLAMEAVRREGWRVIVPDFTMVACARAVSMADMVPIFVDCDESLRMLPRSIECCMSPYVAAIMAVHIYGRRCDMERIHEIARNFGVPVIEDMAELHGVQPHPNTFAAAYSFYANKIVHGQEGGAVCFRRKEDADRARHQRCLGFTEEHDFIHYPRGYNYRMSDIHAGMISHSLGCFGSAMHVRRKNERHCDELIPECFHMPERQSPWVYDIRLPGTDTTAIVRLLNSRGVPARLGFKPMSMQPEYRGHYHVCQMACRMSQEIIYLPLDKQYDLGPIDWEEFRRD